MKKTVLLGFMCMAVLDFLSAQTANELDAILNTQEITCSQAVHIVLTAAEVLPEGGNDIFMAAKDRRWLSAKTEADNPIQLGELSLLIMKAFEIKGGVMYAWFPNPRYACRELAYLQIIQGRIDPEGRMDGRTFLQILGRALAYTGGDGG
ncbi:MAG: hypothetical protein LBT16_09895 [Treponema sp.]|jgi:hypothetical protein|nr:hypothetical protein [Treponema sp.]